MKDDRQYDRLIDCAGEILRPESGELAEAASLDAGLRAIRWRRRRRTAIRWGAVAAAALVAVAAIVITRVDRQFPVAGELPSVREVSTISSQPLSEERLVRTQRAANVVRTRPGGPVFAEVVRTGDRPPAWIAISDEELFSLFNDRPVGIVAWHDGRKQLILPREIDRDLLEQPR